MLREDMSGAKHDINSLINVISCARTLNKWDVRTIHVLFKLITIIYAVLVSFWGYYCKSDRL